MIKSPITWTVSAVFLFMGGLLMIVLFTFVSAISINEEQQQSSSNPCASTGSLNLTGNDNIQKAWNYFSQFYSKTGVAAILGNFMVESGMNPRQRQIGGGPGIGLPQWSIDGRWVDENRFANSEGLDPFSLEAQFAFIQIEMTSGRQGKYDQSFNNMPLLDAVAYYEQYYENAGRPNMTSRNNYAISIYNQFANSGGAVSASTPITSQCTGSGSSNASANAQNVITEAEKYLGVPYVWGGATPVPGFDCSGLMQYSFHSVGINLPRTAAEQQMVGTKIDPTQVQPGDLVFMGFPAFHVGMYIGDGKWIEAPETGDVVKIVPYNPTKFTSATRVLQ